MVKKKLFAATALALSSTLLAGCGSSANFSSIDPDSTLALIEVVEMDMGSLSGGSMPGEKHKLLVVSDDGSTSVVEGNDSGALLVNWTKNALLVADSDSDFWAVNGKEAVTGDNKKTLSMMLSSVALGDSGAVLYTSFDGSGEDAVYTVVKQGSAETTKEKAFLSNFASCGDVTYGLEVNTDFMSAGFEDLDNVDWESMTEEEMDKMFSSVTYDDRAEVSLYKVAEGDEISMSRIGKHTAIMDDVTVLSESLACSGNEVAMLTMQSEVDGGLYKRTQDPGEPVNFNISDFTIESEAFGNSILTIERWNIETGERTVIPVVGEDKKPYMKVFDLLLSSSAGGASLQDGTFYWVDGLGRLVATDMETGVSKALSDSLQTSSDMDKLAQMVTSFHEGYVDILVHSTAEPDKDRIVRLEIPSGKEIMSVDVPKLGGLVEAIDISDMDAMESMSSMSSVVAFYTSPHPKS